VNDFHIKIGIERPEGQQPGDPRDLTRMRQEIYLAMRDSALVRNIMYCADHEGLSAEDRYTLLAYEALVALETNWKQVLRGNSCRLESLLRQINTLACYASEENTDAREAALLEIGKLARSAPSDSDEQ
jgi:hypothetical protein